MIGRLEGPLRQIRPGEVIVEAGGVGYLVAISLRDFQRVAGAGRGELWIHTQVRSDAIVLYGFVDRADLDAFERLISVAGVGPRTALAVLSAMTAGELGDAVAGGDSARLERTPGVGRKTAERIVLELRGALPDGSGVVDDVLGDAISALVNLGYNQREARRAVQAAASQTAAGDLPEILRLSLQHLTR